MLKVLLVDDEPFIIQGLKVLIDWEQEGIMIWYLLDSLEGKTPLFSCIKYLFVGFLFHSFLFAFLFSYGFFIFSFLL